ncbi:FG-GAP-like repeat-containing protein [Granulicella mallensis]|uniref:FG-GAP repeat protein n=1 Tax=Granulicella mallensis (strain ATCC BAA-1857 / DSM 23137 / MP5ACTX8) TaxID=682795 RepID=G8NS42_GRAMM|nr:FG-GAP-like repeat-containing protein [Granulicella mallensis]AEU36250.1 FG-GAP repeat protein [Granulicella mallensis MP5ACTX8]
MRTTPLARLVSTFALFAVFASVAARAMAQNVQGSAPASPRVAPSNPFMTKQGSNARPTPIQHAQSAARQLNPKLKTPFDRQLAPTLAQMLKPVSTTGATGKALSMKANAAGAASVIGNTPNFPTFVAAPFLVPNSSDTSTLYVTVTGDFNNDGKPDVAAIQNDGSISIILNPGSLQNLANITPLPPDTSATSIQPFLTTAYAADMNGDGNLDLVGMDYGNNNILVWMGKGDGTFAKVVIYPVAPANGAGFFYGGFILVGDFNNDGKPDVVALTSNLDYNTFHSTFTLQTFLNDGKGNLTVLPSKQENNVTFNDYYTVSPAQAAVLSNDGSTTSGIVFLLADMGVANKANTGETLICLSSKADGTFSTPVEPAGPTITDSPLALSFGSLYATNLSVPVTAPKPGQPAPSISAGAPVTDIVFMTGDGTVYDSTYQPNTGSFTLPAPKILVGANQNNPPSGGTTPSFPIPNEALLNLADMNNDGVLDLLVYTAGSTLIFPGTGNHTYGAPTQVVGGLGGDQQPQPANFDGSGFNSFVWSDSYLNELGYYQNMGAFSASSAGQFYAAPPVSGASFNGGANYSALGSNIQVEAVGDFNKDGLQDVIAFDLSNLAANSGYPDLVVGLNNGNPNSSNQVNNFTFATVVPAATLVNINFEFVEPFTVKNTLGTSLLLGTGGGMDIVTASPSGSFGTPTPLNLGTSISCSLGYGDTGDVNGDGIPDIVIAYAGDSTCGGSTTPSGFFTFLGKADGTFNTATFTPLGGSLYMVKLINFSGASGNLDLAADDMDNGNFLTGASAFYAIYAVPNNADGSGTFNTTNLTENAVGYIVSDIIPGDFNNDGQQDLTLTTEGQYVPGSFTTALNSMGVLLLPSQGQVVQYGQTYLIFGTPSLVDTGFYALWGSYADFNGDGYPDLALATVNSAAGLGNPFSQPPPVPLVQILPNQNGSFGPVLTEMDSAESFEDPYSMYTFTGNFGNTGGNDLLVTGLFNTAEFLNQGANALALSATPGSPAQGAPVTLTATLSGPVTGYTATGSVSFSANGTVLGAAPLSGNTAAFTTIALIAGTNKLTASYSGDEFHNASTANATVNVGAPSAPMFSLTASTSSMTLQQGATGSAVLNLVTNGTFTGVVSFTCSGAPTASACTISPASLTLGANQAGNVSVILATTPQNNQYQAGNRSWMERTGGLSLAGLLLFLVPRRRHWRGKLAIVALALVSLGSIAMLNGCSGNGGNSGNSNPDKYPGTPTGTSTLTVTATSGSITQTQTIALTVTQ